MTNALPLARSCKASDCLAENWLAFLGHKWNAMILWQLANAPLRFGELESALSGISPKTLTERLSALLESDLIERDIKNSFPREVRYALSPRGKELGSILQSLYQWAERDAARQENAA